MPIPERREPASHDELTEKLLKWVKDPHRVRVPKDTDRLIDRLTRVALSKSRIYNYYSEFLTIEFCPHDYSSELFTRELRERFPPTERYTLTDATARDMLAWCIARDPDWYLDEEREWGLQRTEREFADPVDTGNRIDAEEWYDVQKVIRYFELDGNEDFLHMFRRSARSDHSREQRRKEGIALHRDDEKPISGYSVFAFLSAHREFRSHPALRDFDESSRFIRTRIEHDVIVIEIHHMLIEPEESDEVDGEYSKPITSVDAIQLEPRQVHGLISELQRLLEELGADVEDEEW